MEVRTPEPMQAFARLLERSQLFAQQLLFLYERSAPAAGGARPSAAAQAAELAIEHGGAVRLLFETGMPGAACAQLRCQHDAVVRGGWALYAASDDDIARLGRSREADADAGPAAGDPPGVLDMLAALQARAAAQPRLAGLVAPLGEIRAVHWRAMDPFLRGGLHPRQRDAAAFPMPRAERLVRVSNALTHLGFRLLARLGRGGKGSAVARIDGAWKGFEDCLPGTPASPT